MRPSLFIAAVLSLSLGLLAGCSSALYRPNPRAAAPSVTDAYNSFVSSIAQARFYSSGSGRTENDEDWQGGWCQMQEVAALDNGSGVQFKMKLESQQVLSATHLLVFQEIRGIAVIASKPGDRYDTQDAHYAVKFFPLKKRNTQLYFPYGTAEQAKTFADALSKISIASTAEVAAAVQAKNEEDRRKAEEAAAAAKAKAEAEAKAAQERQARIDRVLQSEKMGLAMEHAKKFRDAFHKYLSAYLSNAEGLSPGVKPRILLRLLKVSGKLNPPAGTPKAASDAFLRGKEVLKTAVEKDEIKKAEVEFRNALGIAPWWGEAYFHLAQVQERLGEIADAKQNLEWYVMINPKAEDLDLVKKMIARLDVEAQNARSKQ